MIKNNKIGFTLIELLAVIVILAIIAVITVPMIMNVIDKAKIGALEDSAYGLIESANLYYSENISNISDKVIFEFVDGKQVSDNKLNYKGKIDNGKLIINTDGKIVTCIDNGTNYAYKELSESKVVTGSGTCSYDGDTGDFTIVSDTDTLNKKVTELQNELNELKSIGNATASDILVGKTAIVQGKEIIGAFKSKIIKKSLGTNAIFSGSCGSDSCSNNKTTTFNVNSISNYEELTVDNIQCNLNNSTSSQNGSSSSWTGSGGYISAISYNNTTGIYSVVAYINYQRYINVSFSVTCTLFYNES